MLFFQTCIVLFSFRIWSSMEWWGFIFKIKLLEISRQSASACPVLPLLRTWSKRWPRSSGRTCGCCRLPSTRSTRCTSAEVSACPTLVSRWLSGRSLVQAPFDRTAAPLATSAFLCRGWGSSGRVSKAAACLGNVLVSSEHMCLLAFGKNIRIFYTLVSPDVSSMAFHN